MPPDERERLLNNWAMSSIPQRRTFFHTVKRLAAFFAFGVVISLGGLALAGVVAMTLMPASAQAAALQLQDVQVQTLPGNQVEIEREVAAAPDLDVVVEAEAQ